MASDRTLPDSALRRRVGKPFPSRTRRQGPLPAHFAGAVRRPGGREYRALTARAAATQALEANVNCLRSVAPYRIVEAEVADARVFDRRASLRLAGAPTEAPFSVVVFGESFAQWDGPALASLTGARIRVRGPLGVFRDEPQLCLDHSSQLEVLPER
jgi:hypothetical protein